MSIRAELANLGAVGPDDVPARLWEAAMTTPVGDISHPVLTEYGYHIVKVIDRIDTKSLPNVSNKIRTILKKQHNQEVFNQFKNRLYKHYNVTFPSNLRPVHLRPLDQR